MTEKNQIAKDMATWWRNVLLEYATFTKNGVTKDQANQFRDALQIEIQDTLDFLNYEYFELRIDYGRISQPILNALNKTDIAVEATRLFFNKTEMVISEKKPTLMPIPTLHFKISVSKARYNAQYREEFQDFACVDVQMLQGSTAHILYQKLYQGDQKNATIMRNM